MEDTQAPYSLCLHLLVEPTVVGSSNWFSCTHIQFIYIYIYIYIHILISTVHIQEPACNLTMPIVELCMYG